MGKVGVLVVVENELSTNSGELDRLLARVPRRLPPRRLPPEVSRLRLRVLDLLAPYHLDREHEADSPLVWEFIYRLPDDEAGIGGESGWSEGVGLAEEVPVTVAEQMWCVLTPDGDCHDVFTDDPAARARALVEVLRDHIASLVVAVKCRV